MVDLQQERHSIRYAEPFCYERHPPRHSGGHDARIWADEFRQIGALICQVVEGLSRNGPEGDGQVEEQVRGKVAELCAAFPVYPGR